MPDTNVKPIPLFRPEFARWLVAPSNVTSPLGLQQIQEYKDIVAKYDIKVYPIAMENGVSSGYTVSIACPKELEQQPYIHAGKEMTLVSFYYKYDGFCCGHGTLGGFSAHSIFTNKERAEKYNDLKQFIARVVLERLQNPCVDATVIEYGASRNFVPILEEVGFQPTIRFRNRAGGNFVTQYHFISLPEHFSQFSHTY